MMTPQRLNLFPLVREVIDEEIFAEAVGASVEGATSIDAGHLVDEAFENRAIVEHEGIDGDPFARAALGLF